MQNSIFNKQNIFLVDGLPEPEVFDSFARAWLGGFDGFADSRRTAGDDTGGGGGGSELCAALAGVRLTNAGDWQNLDAADLVKLCRQWKREYLGGAPDRNHGTLEWLMCILRHRATNYDRVLIQTAAIHAWTPGFSSLLRLRADQLITNFLRGRRLYGALVRECQSEWEWHRRKSLTPGG